MVVMEQTQSSLIGRSFSEALSIADGRLTLLALAPRSVLSYLWFLVRLLLPKKISLARLPGAVGLIRTDRVLLEAPRGVDYSLDGTLASAKAIEFRILEQRMRLLPGPALVPRQDQGTDQGQRQDGPSARGRDGPTAGREAAALLQPRKRGGLSRPLRRTARRKLRSPLPSWCSRY